MTQVIRTARHTDVPGLHQLIESAYRGDGARRGWTHEADLLGGQRTDAAALQEILSDPHQRMLLVEDDGVILGCVVVAERAGGAYLGMLTVRPELQGHGLGRTLLDSAENLARDMFDAGEIEMTVIRQREELIAWYERRGYVRTGERRPFPHHDPRFGVANTPELEFAVLAKPLPR